MSSKKSLFSTATTALFEKLFGDMLSDARRKIQRAPFSVVNAPLEMADQLGLT